MKAQLYKIPGPWSGHLAIVPRPRGGEWLEAEIRAWKAAGIDAVVSLLVSAEEWELGLREEAAVSQSAGIRFYSFPYPRPPDACLCRKVAPPERAAFGFAGEREVDCRPLPSERRTLGPAGSRLAGGSRRQPGRGFSPDRTGAGLSRPGHAGAAGVGGAIPAISAEGSE